MRWKYFIPLLAVSILFVAGCEDDDDDNGGGTGIAGTWSGSGTYDRGVPIQNFTLHLTRTENTLGGTYSVTRSGRDTMTGNVNGTVNQSNIDITMSPHGNASGSVSGGSMTLRWYESGFDGVGGFGTVNLAKQ